MSVALKNIDINSIQEETITVDELKNKIKKELNDNSILKSETTFESDVWILGKETTKTYDYIHWSNLNDLKKFNFISDTDITILKCWIGDEMIEGAVKVKPKIDSVIDFVIKTNNFNKSIIKNKKRGDVVLTYINSLEGRKQYDAVENLKEYIYYLEDKDLVTDEHYDVLESLISVKFEKRKDKRRKLPNESDILTFDYYLKYFFKDEEIEDDMKLMFYPVLIWWKVTNVIPMRPVELCTRLKRDCLEEVDGKYYLHVDRAKVDVGKNKTVGRKQRIPLLNKLSITKDIFDLINEYIKLTEWDTDTKTLFSYRTLKKIRDKYLVSENIKNGQVKINEDYFTTTVLDVLINRFYETVMKDIYSVEIIDRKISEKNKKLTSIYGSRILDKLDIGDTRHIAFTSLLLQGVSPIEIAMLGGHTSLSSQDHYQGHALFYADSEIINLVTQRNFVHKDMDTTLKDIVFSKSETPPRNLKECIPTEDGVGYCTINLNLEKLDCTGDCLRCKHWWCEPTNENYIILEDYLKDNVIMPLEREILTEEAYLRNLLASKKTVSVDGALELEREYENELMRVVKRINRNVTLNKYNIKSLSENKSVIEGLQKISGGNNGWLELKEK